LNINNKKEKRREEKRREENSQLPTPQLLNQNMSPIYYWGGRIETTSFDLVIFGTDGNVFKKVVGTNGLSTWANLTIEGGILNWSLCDQLPITGSECLNIHTIWWNIVPLKNEYEDMSHILHFFIGPEEDMYSWHCIHDVRGMNPLGSRWSPASAVIKRQEGLMCEVPLLNLYKGSIPLSDITVSLVGYVWTCDNCSNNLPEKCTCGDWSVVEEEEEEVEKRVDPFNLEYYTKREFLSYYGDSHQWDMMSPEKVLERQMIGEIIAVNKNFLSTKNVNHLLDKMIETFQ